MVRWRIGIAAELRTQCLWVRIPLALLSRDAVQRTGTAAKLKPSRLRVRIPPASLLIITMWWNWQTHDAQNVEPTRRRSSNLLFVTFGLQASWCWADSHKVGNSVRFRGLQLFGRVVQWLRHLHDTQEIDGSIPSAIT